MLPERTTSRSPVKIDDAREYATFYSRCCSRVKGGGKKRKRKRRKREFTISRKFVSLHACKPRLRDPLLTIMERFIVPNTMTGLFLADVGEGRGWKFKRRATRTVPGKIDGTARGNETK